MTSVFRERHCSLKTEVIYKVNDMYSNVLDYLEKTADKYPGKIAYADQKSEYTFEMLEDTAKRIGTKISEAVSTNNPVVVYMDRRAYDIVTFMGVVYAGCFYVPIDAHMPIDRINLILNTLKPGVLIYDEVTSKNLENLEYSGVSFDFEEISKTDTDQKALDSIRSRSKSTDLLYVLFTSGSTGIPKGVTISHLAAIDFMEWVTEKYKMDESTSLCGQAPFYFDASMPDIYIPICVGASLYLPPKMFYTFPKKILGFIQEKRINTLIWVPSALCNVVNCKAFDVVVPDCIKLVIFCGEIMPCKHLNVWKKNVPDALYVNMYGPTEATYACMYYDITRDFTDDEKLPLGKACENSEILLITDDNKPAKQGEMGEICILGQCLSNGYYNNPERTAAAFVQNPLNTKWIEYMYKTGDLAFVDENGDMIFAGRKDFQIKKLGHRIELGEIENAVISVPGIDNACCLFNEDKGAIVLVYAGKVSEEDLLSAISNKIPGYMKPDVVVQLNAIPMNINGKIDRPRLKEEYAKD